MYLALANKYYCGKINFLLELDETTPLTLYETFGKIQRNDNERFFSFRRIDYCPQQNFAKTEELC